MFISTRYLLVFLEVVIDTYHNVSPALCPFPIFEIFTLKVSLKEITQLLLLHKNCIYLKLKNLRCGSVGVKKQVHAHVYAVAVYEPQSLRWKKLSKLYIEQLTGAEALWFPW